nr:protein IQ-DOMAIN 14-like [Aegilops tauschii subsp. strangulata]
MAPPPSSFSPSIQSIHPAASPRSRRLLARERKGSTPSLPCTSTSLPEQHQPLPTARSRLPSRLPCVSSTKGEELLEPSIQRAGARVPPHLVPVAAACLASCQEPPSPAASSPTPRQVRRRAALPPGASSPEAFASSGATMFVLPVPAVRAAGSGRLRSAPLARVPLPASRRRASSLLRAEERSCRRLLRQFQDASAARVDRALNPPKLVDARRLRPPASLMLVAEHRCPRRKPSALPAKSCASASLT